MDDDQFDRDTINQNHTMNEDNITQMNPNAKPPTQEQRAMTEEDHAAGLLDMATGVLLDQKFASPTTPDIIAMAQVIATARLTNVLGHTTQVMLGGMQR